MKFSSYLILLSMALSLASNSFAQNNKATSDVANTTSANILSLEDLMPGGNTYRKFIPSMPQNLAWLGDKLTYLKGDSILFVDNKTGKDNGIALTLAELKEALSEKDLTSLSGVRPAKNNNWLINFNNQISIYSPTDREVVAKFKVRPNMSNFDLNQSSMLLAYTIDNNLYLENSSGNRFEIEPSNNKRIITGQSVHQNEFGINKGTFWSPSGKLLAFYKMDESMVGVYPLVDTSTRMATLKERVYPMAGENSHEVKIGVYDIGTKKITYLETGNPKDRYFTNIEWNPQSTIIYIAELNRKQNEMQLNAYDAATGKKIKTLFTESSDTYVEPQHPVVFLPNDTSKFIWQSNRDGFNHLYLYNTEGKQLKQLTKGNFDVLSYNGINASGTTIFYTSNENNPLNQQAYKQNIKNGKKTLLTSDEGINRISLNESADYLIDWYSSQNNPGAVKIINTINNKSIQFHQASNPYEGFVMPEIILGSLKSDDESTDLYYRLVLPVDFDPTKKYPAVVYVYGGPHSQLVTNGWLGSARGWDIYMAEKGYIVFTLDNRGTNGRGKDFETATHRQLGIIETEDQMTGIKFLQSLPYVDQERIGVHGWSYGGFMTLNMMLRHPEVFKVGVAGGPVVDWKYYEIMYGERYMGTPQDNPDGYAETDMKNHINKLDGRLMLVIGDVDPVVLPQHTSELIRKAVTDRVYPDLFIYPGHEHNVGGKDRVHLYENITRYFEDHLKPIKVK